MFAELDIVEPVENEPVTVDAPVVTDGGVTAADVERIVSEVSQRDGVVIRETVEGVSQDVAALSETVETLSKDGASTAKAVSALAKSAGESPDSYTVVLSDEQWATVRDCWHWAQGGVSVCLYLVLVTALLVSALLGSRLWGMFSKGWRHG